MPSGIKQAFASRLTDVDTVAREQLGVLRFEGNKVYKYVEFKNTTATVAAAAGSLVAYAAAAQNGYDIHRVVVDLTDADAAPIAAGVAMAAVAGVLGTSYYGWIQVRGIATLDTAVTSGTAGVPIRMTTTDKTAQRANEVDTAGAYWGVFGQSLNTTTKVVLNCVF